MPQRRLAGRCEGHLDSKDNYPRYNTGKRLRQRDLQDAGRTLDITDTPSDQAPTSDAPSTDIRMYSF